MKKIIFLILLMSVLLSGCSKVTDLNNKMSVESSTKYDCDISLQNESEEFRDCGQKEVVAASDFSETLSSLTLTSMDASVSDSADRELSEKMMKDFLSFIGEDKTYYSLGRCDATESDFLKNGYAFVLDDPSKYIDIGYFYYAIPDRFALYECNVNSDFFICFKDNMPADEDKATQFAKSVMGEDVFFENVHTDGFYLFWHNDTLLYVNWECTQIFVDTDDGGKNQIYPTDTIGYFK